MSVDRITKEIRQAWSDSAPLTAAALLMLPLLTVAAAGLGLDGRMITGAPAWLKPAKFALSTAIFAGSLAWLYRYVKVWPRFTRALAWIISLLLVLELAIINIQAARGLTSHFNVGTPLDAALWYVMGSAIVVIWLASIGLLVALFRQPFADRAWGWWLRLGLAITVLGAAAGGAMTSPTADQMEALRAGDSVVVIGAHTVGAPDGGAGLPVTGWSTEHGDLRIPHFFGLHGLQILALMGWLAGRGAQSRTHRPGTRLAFAAAASYTGFIALLAWQALRGQSIVAPDAVTLAAFGVWLAATAALVFIARAAAPDRRTYVSRSVS